MVAVFECDVDSGAITGGPNAVRQIPDRNGGDQSWTGAALIDLHLVGATDRDVGGNNFLRKPTHLRVLAIEKFCSRHVNSSLMMRQHQVHEVRIFVSGWFCVSHGCVHRLHVLHQGGPACIVRRHVAHRMILRPHGDCDDRNHYQIEEPSSESHFVSPSLCSGFSASKSNKLLFTHLDRWQETSLLRVCLLPL
jgi:hypothetical protein